MPYNDPEDFRKQHAAWYIARYRTVRKFKTAEAKRKAAWYALRASDPAWLAEQAAKKRLQRAEKKKINRKS